MNTPGEQANTERAGFWTGVRVGAYGTSTRGEWVRVGIVIGDENGTEWARRWLPDWRAALAQRAMIGVNDLTVEVIEQFMALDDWATHEAISESDSSARSFIQYDKRLPVVILDDVALTAETLAQALLYPPENRDA